MEKIQSIRIVLNDWAVHYPTGCVIKFMDDTEDGEYCDNVEEYKSFLSQYEDAIKRDKPTVIVSFDIDDYEVTTVMDVVREIKKYLDEIRGY